MSAHTPGPWQISKGDYGISRIYSTAEDGAPFYVASNIPRDEDARLIAAVPEQQTRISELKALLAAIVHGADMMLQPAVGVTGALRHYIEEVKRVAAAGRSI